MLEKSSARVKSPVILAANVNVIKRWSAEIVAVLRSHEGAAVVGGMKSSNLQRRSRSLPASRPI